MKIKPIVWVVFFALILVGFALPSISPVNGENTMDLARDADKGACTSFRLDNGETCLSSYNW